MKKKINLLFFVIPKKTDFFQNLQKIQIAPHKIFTTTTKNKETWASFYSRREFLQCLNYSYCSYQHSILSHKLYFPNLHHIYLDKIKTLG